MAGGEGLERGPGAGSIERGGEVVGDLDHLRLGVDGDLDVEHLTGLDTGGVQLVAADGRNITTSFSTLTTAATVVRKIEGPLEQTMTSAANVARKVDSGEACDDGVA